MADNLEEKIRYKAYMLWEADGHPAGKEMDYWLKAEVEIKSELVRTAGPKGTAKMAPAKKTSSKKAASKKTGATIATANRGTVGSTKKTAAKKAPKQEGATIASANKGTTKKAPPKK